MKMNRLNRPWEGRAPAPPPPTQADLLHALERAMDGQLDEKKVRIRRLAEEIDALSGIIDSLPQA